MEGWNERNMARLTEMWEARDAEGRPVYSAVDIAEAFGITKNSVIGKARRLHLTPRQSPIKPKGSGARPKPPRVGNPHGHQVARHTLAELMPAVVMPTTQATYSNGAAHADGRRAGLRGPTLTTTQAMPAGWQAVGCARACQWPLSDGKPWLFCDVASVPGRSYCAAHTARAFIWHGREPIAHPVGF